MSEDWGPWIEHDGKGCPCYGFYVEAKFASGEFRRSGRVGRYSSFEDLNTYGLSCWVWSPVPTEPDHVISYRIRKPRALQQLIDLAENLPADKPVEVDA